MPTRPRRGANTSGQDATQEATGGTSTSRTTGPTQRSDRGPKIVTGHVVADPQIRFTGSGKVVANFKVQDQNTRWNVTAWEGKAEEVADKLRQGDGVKVMGRLQNEREFDLATGGKGKSSHEVTAQDVGIEVGDGFVPIDKFDRSMLETPKPGLEAVPDLDTGSLGGGLTD